MLGARGLGLVLLVLAAGCAAPDVPGQPGEAAPEPREVLRVATELGTLTILLYPEAAPLTLDLLRDYAAERYYEGREFTRVVPGHVIQVADRAGGATEDARRVPLETHPAYHFSAGAAGIARSEDPGSGGPELFVMDFATSHLDGNFTVWGQVLDGLEVVHRIARVPAVDASRVPLAGLLVVDRAALDGVAITAFALESIRLPPEEASRYPLQVATNVREGDHRHSLEWPRSLRAGAPAELTWYVRPYNGTAPPAPAEVEVRAAGKALSVEGDADAEGAYHWTWTPPSAGAHEATLVWRGRELATLAITVQAPGPPAPGS